MGGAGGEERWVEWVVWEAERDGARWVVWEAERGGARGALGPAEPLGGCNGMSRGGCPSDASPACLRLAHEKAPCRQCVRDRAGSVCVRCDGAVCSWTCPVCRDVGGHEGVAGVRCPCCSTYFQRPDGQGLRRVGNGGAGSVHARPTGGPPTCELIHWKAMGLVGCRPCAAAARMCWRISMTRPPTQCLTTTTTTLLYTLQHPLTHAYTPPAAATHQVPGPLQAVQHAAPHHHPPTAAARCASGAKGCPAFLFRQLRDTLPHIATTCRCH